MWLFLVIFLQFQQSSGELAAFGRGAPSRPTIISSAQYRSYIMPKIFGGEPNEADVPAENSVSECPMHQARFSNRATASSHFHRVSNYYYNQPHKPVSSVSPYQPSPQSMAYPTNSGQFQATLQPSQPYGQQQTTIYGVQYWHTTPYPPANVGDNQHYHRYTTNNKLGQEARIPSYLEAIPLPKFQPASLGPIPSQVAQKRSSSVVSKDEPGCCPFSPYAAFLTMEQQMQSQVGQRKRRGAAREWVTVKECPSKEYADVWMAENAGSWTYDSDFPTLVEHTIRNRETRSTR